MVAEPWVARPWQLRHSERDGRDGGASRQTTHRGDRHSFVPQILTKTVKDSGVAQPQIVKCPVLVPQEVVREADRTTVYEDDHAEETLQSDEEPAKKLQINEA